MNQEYDKFSELLADISDGQQINENDTVMHELQIAFENIIREEKVKEDKAFKDVEQILLTH